MSRYVHSTALLSLVLLSLAASAQPQIPVGTWRLHLSYNAITHVELSEDKVFAATESGILTFDKQDQTLRTVNKLDGLSSSGITALSYDAETAQLLIGHQAGELDIIASNAIINFNRLAQTDVITSKKINHINSHNRLAYLSTTYGLVVFDLSRREIRETWRDLGASGETLAVNQSVFHNDSVYLATTAGVIGGRITDNLLDYNNWSRYLSTNVQGEAKALATFGGKVYATGEKGLFHLGSDAWIREPFLDTISIQSLSASEEYLYIIADSTIWTLNAKGEISIVAHDLLTAPSIVREDTNGTLWIGDLRAGLVSDAGGSFAALLPNGPSRTTALRLRYEQGKLYMVSGGFSPPLKGSGEVNIFQNGKWTMAAYPLTDITDIALDENRTAISSFGSGLLVIDGGNNTTLLNDANSPLDGTAPGTVNLTALASSAEGLWIANYVGTHPIHRWAKDGTWQSFSIDHPNGRYPTDLAVDGQGNVWIALNPATGGGLVALDPTTGNVTSRTTEQGAGYLPSTNVLSLSADRDGLMWVGTDTGIGYFYSSGEDVQKPIYDGRFLLRDQRITAIKVDAGNRTWIGTGEGAWLFADAGQTLVQHFNTANSPLPSDVIVDIEINAETGEVFFATDRGLASYRGDATEATKHPATPKIFPNPVYPGYTGTIGITGLAEDALVKITDISGALVWQTQAHGGMATWNARDWHGKRVSTGVYLVFSISQDGRESTVGKIAIVE